MLKNKYNILFCGLIICIICSSCNFLNSPEPAESISVGSGIHTIKGYKDYLNGTYNDLQGIVTYILESGDLMSDDAVWAGSFVYFNQIAARSMSANNSGAENIWNGAYKGINSANIIINQAVGKISNVQKGEWNNILGQAYFLRALNYFYLVKLFAKPWGSTNDNSQMGVPLKLKPSTNSSDFKELSRASVKEVYKQILDDLNSAEGLITDSSPARATDDAVLALEARIALIQERWSDAATLAGKVIPDYQLLPDVATYFRKELSAESIFEVVNTANDTPNSVNTSMTAVYNPQFRAGIELSDSYKKAVKSIIPNYQEIALQAVSQKAIDTRTTELLYSSKKNPKGIADYTSSDKYEQFTTLDDNVPILRLPEMILTQAEALAEMNGVNQKSIDLLNEIRTRAIKIVNKSGLPGNEKLIEYKTSDFSNKQELINAILLARRIELSFEGHGTTEFQRRHLDVRGLKWDSNKLVFPIPLSQTDSDPKIKQNPGY